ncbi:MAG TPA: septal ring lytic transglycosylase RlpA family protein [Chthoniobacterales bacterium]
MPSPQNNLRRRICVGVAITILSLGGAIDQSSGQMMNKKPPETKKPAQTEGIAVWYNVPPNSLAKRRAGKDELTAAHNRLPLGTKVRVTHVVNGKSVVVRITDRGITNRRDSIDLCKEAATKLDMLREGSARVRIEILPDDKPSAAKTKTLPW